MKGAEKIYVYPEFTHSCTEKGKGDVEYIRADIVEEMREALEGVLPFTVVDKSDDAWEAVDKAISVLEKMKEEE